MRLVEHRVLVLDSKSLTSQTPRYRGSAKPCGRSQTQPQRREGLKEQQFGHPLMITIGQQQFGNSNLDTH
jgi:hypothetical protein